MYKAYDTILQAEVSAVLAAQNGKSEPYRYECLCCGEEVYIAAASNWYPQEDNNESICSVFAVIVKIPPKNLLLIVSNLKKLSTFISFGR